MQKLIVANWKSNKSFAQAEKWFEEFPDVAVQTIIPVIAPPFPLLFVASQKVQQHGWKLAIQDISPFSAGSYTGAVSATNLQGLPVAYVLVGHSERRRYFHETPQDIALKVEQALEANIQPIICIDEQSLDAQAAALSSDSAKRCIVAYEPAGAIGTGNNASLSQVKECKTRVDQLFGTIPFLYGGSVDEQNIGEYLLITDGILMGSASLDAQQFGRVLQAAQGNSGAD